MTWLLETTGHQQVWQPLSSTAGDNVLTTYAKSVIKYANTFLFCFLDYIQHIKRHTINRGIRIVVVRDPWEFGGMDYMKISCYDKNSTSINSLAPGRCSSFKRVIMSWVKLMSTSSLHNTFDDVNIGSGNGLVPQVLHCQDNPYWWLSARLQ